MNAITNIIKSTLFNGAVAYGGQRLGKTLVRTFIPNQNQKKSGNKEQNILKNPVLLSALSVVATLISPVPARPILKGIATFTIATALGAAAEFFNSWKKNSNGKSTSTTNNASSTQDNGTPTTEPQQHPSKPVVSQSNVVSESAKDKKNTEEQNPPELPDNLTKLSKDDLLKLRKKHGREQFNLLEQPEQRTYVNFKKDIDINDPEFDFNVINLTLFAIKYNNLHKKLITTTQTENLEKNTKELFQKIEKLAKRSNQTINIDHKKSLLNGYIHVYEQALSKNSVRPDEHFRNSLEELLNDFLDNHYNKQLSKSDTK